jgi:serine/threonine protein kinase
VDERKPLVVGLDYLHRVRYMIHRDIKPANILLNLVGRCRLTLCTPC